MERSYVLRGFAVGALAGLLAFIAARIFAEPLIQQAIDYETGRDAAQAVLDRALARGADIAGRGVACTVRIADKWARAPSPPLPAPAVGERFVLPDLEATLRRHERFAAAGVRLLHVTPWAVRRSPESVVARVLAAVRTPAAVPDVGVRALRLIDGT